MAPTQSSVILEMFTVFLVYKRVQSVPISLQTIENQTLPDLWSGGISFIYDDKLNLLGGSNVLNEIYSLDLSSIQLTDNDTKILPSSLNQNTWHKQSVTYPSFTCCVSTSDYSSLGISMYSQQFTINGDRIYIAAPQDVDFELSDFLIFDMVQNEFLDPTSYNSEGAAPNVGVSCVTNNYTHVFVLGGQTNAWTTQLDTNRIYNIRSDSWSEGATLLSAKAHFGCEHNFARDTLYTFGGYITGNRIDTIEKYEIALDQWTDLNPVALSSTRIRLRCILDELNQNNIYCIGGYDAAVVNTVDVFDTSTERITSSNVNALPFANDMSGVTFYNLNVNNILFTTGGATDSSDLDMVQYAIIASPTGATSPPTMKPTLFPTTTRAPTLDESTYQFINFDVNVFSQPVVLQEHIAYVYDNKLNIFGGHTTGKIPIIDTRYELDLSAVDFEQYFVNNVSAEINQTLLSTVDMNNKWTTVNMPYPTETYLYTDYSTRGILCAGTCSTIIAPFLYIINGQSDTQENQNMIVYDMSSNSFVPKSNYNWTLPTDIIAPCVANDDARIFVTGGYDFVNTEQTFTKQIQIYTLAHDTWSLGSEFSVARAHHACATDADKAYVFIFGGYDGTNRIDAIERYNIENDKWHLLSVTSSEPLTVVIGCVLDDITRYIEHDQILCIGGANPQNVPTMDIFDPDAENIQMVRDSLASAVVHSASAIYNIPNSNRHLWFVFGGATNLGSYTNYIQYLTLIEAPPTKSPTADPTAMPTMNPSADPTFAPSDDPSATPTRYPTVSPTYSPTAPPTYHVYWVKTNVEQETMIESNYQQNAINAIESVVHNESYTTYSLTYVSTVLCVATQEYAWQYRAGAAERDIDSIDMLLEDESITSKIGNELANMAENVVYNMTLVNIEDRDKILTQCEDDQVDENKSAGQDSNISSLSYFVLGFVVVLLFVLVIASFIMHSGRSFAGSDSPDYMAVFRYCTNLGDFWSDIIFALHLNALASSLFLWAVVFTVVPYLLSIALLIAFIYIAKTAKADSSYVSIAKYLHKYDYILIGLSLVGGLFPSLSIVSSHLFHLEIFSMDLREDHTSGMQIIRFFNIVLAENLGQLIVQLLFVGKRGLTDSITVISMFFSVLSLLMGFIRTISTVLGRRTSNKQTRDVTRKMSDWLHADTMLGEEAVDSEEEEQQRRTTVASIKDHPNMLFDIKISCSYLTKHHRFTNHLFRKLISEHIAVDETCLELFGFNMNSTHDELQFYVEISLIKLMRFEVDLNRVSYSRVKNKMLSITQMDQENDFVFKVMKKLKIKSSVEEISVTCDYKGDAQMISLANTDKT